MRTTRWPCGYIQAAKLNTVVTSKRMIDAIAKATAATTEECEEASRQAADAELKTTRIPTIATIVPIVAS